MSFPIHDYKRHVLGAATCLFADSSLASVRTREIRDIDNSSRPVHYEQRKFSAPTAFLSSVVRAIIVELIAATAATSRE